ncbi:hypothetical protein PAA26_03750 [Methanomassiliicoccaceae archaeon COG_1]|nr:hypothetical protein [Methanomassiliicoccaceae archaeon COG_1]
MVTVELCNKLIPALMAVVVLIGFLTGYYYHRGDSETMFIPLSAGFVVLFVMYYFIDKRSETIAASPS